MTVKMTASRRFRWGKPFVWLNPGDEYTVSSEQTADRHVEKGRGVRAKEASKSTKKGE